MPDRTDAEPLDNPIRISVKFAGDEAGTPEKEFYPWEAKLIALMAQQRDLAMKRVRLERLVRNLSDRFDRFEAEIRSKDDF